MATLVLQSIGAVAGQFLGGPIGAAIGQTIGAVAGSAIDQRLFAPGGRDVSGPRLTSLSGIASNEGAAIARVYGRARVAKAPSGKYAGSGLTDGRLIRRVSTFACTRVTKISLPIL